VLLFLEGGYRLSVMPQCAAACLQVLIDASTAQEGGKFAVRERNGGDVSDGSGGDDDDDDEGSVFTDGDADDSELGSATCGTAVERRAALDFVGSMPSEVSLADPMSSAHRLAAETVAARRSPTDSTCRPSSPTSEPHSSETTSSEGPMSELTTDERTSSEIFQDQVILMGSSERASPAISNCGNSSIEIDDGGSSDAEGWSEGLLPAAVAAIEATRAAHAGYWPFLAR
jgi:hypothetical protein